MMFQAQIKVGIELNQNWPDAQSGASRSFEDDFEREIASDVARREAVHNAALVAGQQLRLLAAALGATFEDGGVVHAFTSGWLDD
jgi:hypothetical protein